MPGTLRINVTDLQKWMYEDPVLYFGGTYNERMGRKTTSCGQVDNDMDDQQIGLLTGRARILCSTDKDLLPSRFKMATKVATNNIS